MDERKSLRPPVFNFTEKEKHQIIQEMLSTGCTKDAIWKKYTGRGNEHGKILNWMRQYGYHSAISPRRSTFETNVESMAKKKSTPTDSESEKDNFENLQLKKRIAELEKQLKDAELKAIAFSTMIDIAEKELKILIRKKFNTKP